MAIVGLGLDVCAEARIRRILEGPRGQRFRTRVFTPKERAYCEGRGDGAAAYAVRFAAKEAAVKALGCGIGDVTWKEVEILGDEQNAPVLRLYGAAEQKAKEQGWTTWSVSISHSQSHSVAVVVAIG